MKYFINRTTFNFGALFGCFSRVPKSVSQNTRKCPELSPNIFRESFRVFNKSNVVLSIRVQTTLNHIRFVFYHNINVKEIFYNNCQNFRALIDASSVVYTLISQSECEIRDNCGKKCD